MATIDQRFLFLKDGIALLNKIVDSPNVAEDEAKSDFSALLSKLMTQRGKKPGRKGAKYGGSDPSLATGSPIYNVSGLAMGAGAGPAAVPTSPFVNAPQPFSAGMPVYGSAEHGFNTDVTNVTSGGLLQGGGKKKGKRVSRKKA
jgi:hypothetical protein